jgi:hypothetical protein
MIPLTGLIRNYKLASKTMSIVSVTFLMLMVSVMHIFVILNELKLNLSKVSYLAKSTSDLQGNIHSRASVNKTARDSFFSEHIVKCFIGWPYDSFLSTVWCVSVILCITSSVFNLQCVCIKIVTSLKVYFTSYSSLFVRPCISHIDYVFVVSRNFVQ